MDDILEFEKVTRLPDRWDPPRLIECIHALGQFLGYQPTRIDRDQLITGEYYEVGYGSGTVTVTAEWGRWQVTKENYRPDKGPALLELLIEKVTA